MDWLNNTLVSLTFNYPHSKTVWISADPTTYSGRGLVRGKVPTHDHPRPVPAPENWRPPRGTQRGPSPGAPESRPLEGLPSPPPGGLIVVFGGRHQYKKAVLSQRWSRNAPYIWVPWKFSGLPDYVHGHYSQYFHGLLFRSTLWMFLQNLKSVALPVAEIIGGPLKIRAVPGYVHAPFSENFLMAFYSDRPFKYTRQIWSP